MPWAHSSALIYLWPRSDRGHFAFAAHHAASLRPNAEGLRHPDMHVQREGGVMHTVDEHPASSSGEGRPLRRPPYGMPFRPRRSSVQESDPLGWRTYSTPTPPERPPWRRWGRLVRPALIAGFMTCAGFGLWAHVLGPDSAPPREETVSLPQPIIGARPAEALSSPPSTPRATPDANRKKRETKRVPRGNRNRSPVSDVPRQHRQHIPVTPRRKAVSPSERAEGQKRRGERSS